VYLFVCINRRTLFISALKAAALKCVSHTDVFRKTGKSVYLFVCTDLLTLSTSASKATASKCALTYRLWLGSTPILGTRVYLYTFFHVYFYAPY